ncbi:hypothetical protein PEBR_00505 [Penicillium brasilianum]|uniref:Uncharacterized protein n=1 Tax=Penicillium brasilianum TaxID=104259 RepID=A0A1S9S0Y6_PENBI|nr:hypothetical protein PEBR_00505 [Penicillium brasilianum]
MLWLPFLTPVLASQQGQRAVSTEKEFHHDPWIVRLFLDNGLDPKARISSGEPLLSMIFNPSAAAVLLSAGADPNLRGPRGVPPLGSIIVSTQEPDTSTSMLELYLEHGAKLESTLLFYSVAPRIQQRELMTRFLLDRGADPNVTSGEVGTSLHLAARNGKVEIVKMLLEAGADPTVMSVGRRIGEKTPAQVAEHVGHTETRGAILETDPCLDRRADFLAKRSNLVKRSRSKCGPNLASAATGADIVNLSVRNVSLGYIRLEHNGTSRAAHRVERMELPNESMGVLIEYEIPNLRESIVPYEEAEMPEDMSTGVFKKSTPSAPESSIALEHSIFRAAQLCIVSVGRAYGQTQDELFHSTVIDMLTDGGASHPKLDDSIEDEYIKAYIVHPTTTWNDVAGGYADRWETVRTTVGEIIPSLQDRSRWMDVTYMALNNDDPRLDAKISPAGKNIFKHDPRHRSGGQTRVTAMVLVKDELTPVPYGSMVGA